MNYGELYDAHVAETYDRDELGLLGGVRDLALAQIRASSVPADATVLDLGAGTGESLAALRGRIARGRFIAVDLSSRMLDIARTKLPVETHVDDALNGNAHVADGSVDLVLAHFLTTFVDRRRLFAVARRALRAGGIVSVASSPREALARMRQVVSEVLGDPSAVDAASPAPPNDGTMQRELEACGFTVLATETFRRPVSFASFDECLLWGLQSGFLAQAVEALGPERVAGLRPFVPHLFPFEDEYVGVAISAIARDPDRR